MRTFSHQGSRGKREWPEAVGATGRGTNGALIRILLIQGASGEAAPAIGKCFVCPETAYLRTLSGTQSLDLFLINVGASGWGVAAMETVTLTTSWQRFTLTATNQAALTSAYLQIGGGYTLTNGESISVWGVQMVVGSNADGYVETQNTTTVAGSSQTLAANGLNQAYSYDAFGNLQETGTYRFMQAYTTSNQLSGWNYDAAGNLLTDGLGNTYQYDAEGKIKSGAGAAYLYTADGRRVEKSGSSATVDTVYFNGKPIARLTAGPVWTDLIYGSGGLLVEVPGTQTGSPTYRMTDHLGSVVGTLSSAGALVGSQDLAPFGEVFAGQVIDPFVFSGQERDAESGNDYFGARYYASSMGRFLSPDPLGGSVANPQSLNKYVYAVNNPLRFVDPSGLYHCVWSEGSSGFDEDDTPENGGATEQQCSDQGGESWSPDPGDLPAPSNTTNFQIGTGGSNSSPQSSQSGSNGAFDSNSAAGQLFGAQGAPYWVGANQFVTNATIGYTGMYGAVLGAPAAYSGAVSAAARGFGWYYGYTGASGVVLGTFADDYQGVAQSIGANYLNAPTGVYSFFNNADEWWTLNQGFLESSIFRGQQFYLSSEPMGTGGFYMEMQYLQSRGIDPLTLPRALVPR